MNVCNPDVWIMLCCSECCNKVFSIFADSFCYSSGSCRYINRVRHIQWLKTEAVQHFCRFWPYDKGYKLILKRCFLLREHTLLGSGNRFDLSTRTIPSTDIMLRLTRETVLYRIFLKLCTFFELRSKNEKIKITLGKCMKLLLHFVAKI